MLLRRVRRKIVCSSVVDPVRWKRTSNKVALWSTDETDAVIVSIACGRTMVMGRTSSADSTGFAASSLWIGMSSHWHAIHRAVGGGAGERDQAGDQVRFAWNASDSCIVNKLGHAAASHRYACILQH